MFDYLKMYMGNDGLERCTSWGNYSEDIHNLACGEMFTLENDWKNNSYAIIKTTFLGGIPRHFKNVIKEKNVVLSIDEFKKWLIDNGIRDGFKNYQLVTLN